METFGYSLKVWEAAKDEARGALIEFARKQKTVAYSDLVQRMKALDLQAHDPRLDELLGQISTEEAEQGRGMLSVLVVHKTGDLRPGRGFYKCAAALGLDISDEDRLWVDQINKVYAAWPKL